MTNKRFFDSINQQGRTVSDRTNPWSGRYDDQEGIL